MSRSWFEGLDEEKLGKAFLWLMSGLFFCTLAFNAYAGDTGHLKATLEATGNALENGFSSCVSGSTVQVVGASNVRPQLAVFNNSSNTIFLGTAATSGWLLTNGFPLLASATFNFGEMPAALSCEATGDANIRFMRGITE